jgi:hypothetical protein
MSPRHGMSTAVYLDAIGEVADLNSDLLALRPTQGPYSRRWVRPSCQGSASRDPACLALERDLLSYYIHGDAATNLVRRPGMSKVPSVAIPGPRSVRE